MIERFIKRYKIFKKELIMIEGLLILIATLLFFLVAIILVKY